MAVLVAALITATPAFACAQAEPDSSPHQVDRVRVAPGVELEVLDWGGAGTPLVFLAGLTMNAHVFDDFAPRFRDRNRVIGITRRGHGASTWPDSGYAMPTLVADIGAVLDTLGIGRAIFAGHSFAGEEITALAVEDPRRVAALIYIDAVQDLSAAGSLVGACPLGGEFEDEAERRFQDPDAFRRTQLRPGEDGTPGPWFFGPAMEQLLEGSLAPDYASVRAPALSVAYVPRDMDEIFFGLAELSPECVSGAQRMIYGGIAKFVLGMERGTVVALQGTQHNIHLVSPDDLERAMRSWLAEVEGDEDVGPEGS